MWLPTLVDALLLSPSTNELTVTARWSTHTYDSSLETLDQSLGILSAYFGQAPLHPSGPLQAKAAQKHVSGDAAHYTLVAYFLNLSTTIEQPPKPFGAAWDLRSIKAFWFPSLEAPIIRFSEQWRRDLVCFWVIALPSFSSK